MVVITGARALAVAHDTIPKQRGLWLRKKRRARADFSQKRCDTPRSATVARKRRAEAFRATGQCSTVQGTRQLRRHHLQHCSDSRAPARRGAVFARVECADVNQPLTAETRYIVAPIAAHDRGYCGAPPNWRNRSSRPKRRRSSAAVHERATRLPSAFNLLGRA